MAAFGHGRCTLNVLETAPEPDVAPGRDVIAIGASAGGIVPLTEVMRALPGGLPAAVLVVVHLLPTAVSRLAPILDRAGSFEASPALDGEPIEHGHIYVAPPDRHLLMRGSALQVTEPRRRTATARHRSALSQRGASRGPRAIGVVLSGSQTDGAEGLRVLKERGGATVVQDPEDAHYPSMPRHACSATEIDWMCRRVSWPPCSRGLVVGELWRPVAETTRANGDSAGFDGLLEHLKSTRGFDFSGYKRGSLERRVEKRMEVVGVDGYDAYLDHLEVNPDEFTDLFNTILINVTGFFRDKPAWDYLADDVMPELLERRRRRADPRLVGRLRLRGGGLLAGDAAGRGDGRGGLPRAREDLRDRRRRRRPGTGAARGLPARRAQGGRPELREQYFERPTRAATPSAATCAAR